MAALAVTANGVAPVRCLAARISRSIDGHSPRDSQAELRGQISPERRTRQRPHHRRCSRKQCARRRYLAIIMGPSRQPLAAASRITNGQTPPNL